jgi:ubiquinone/menaquinone biosynthesis C-methylase UbiE
MFFSFGQACVAALHHLPCFVIPPFLADNVTNSTGNTNSPIVAHYATGYEGDRLSTGPGQLERIRTQEILTRYLPPAPARVVDVGGGPGVYSAWLATLGYHIDLLDVVPLHVEQARQKFVELGLETARAEVGDARQLPYDSGNVDWALLLGPLYHLAVRDDRLSALREARRVLRPGGGIAVAAISRFASLLDGFFRGFVRDPSFARIVQEDLDHGRHQNPTQNPEYFTTAYFHHPSELSEELEEAGFSDVDLLAVEGPFWCLHDFDETWSNAELRERMLNFLRLIEKDGSIIGASAHLLALARKPT